jgi:hypothetical protein
LQTVHSVVVEAYSLPAGQRLQSSAELCSVSVWPSSTM